MKKLKYLLLLFILFLTPRVYAAEFNMNSYTSATNGGTKNRYRATEIYNTGTSGTFTFGTRYNGRISDIETYFSYPFEQNTSYRFTYNMATEDFRNTFSSSYWWDCSDTMTDNNAHVFNVSYISYKKIQFSIKPTENTTCIRVWVRSSSISNTAITGISNWNLSSITLYDPAWQSGSGSGQGSSSPTPTPSGATNQDIINNQNNNTQDIINNNNDNTNNIIENNNENTESIINNQNNNTNKEINSSCSIKTIELKPRFVGYICNASARLCLNSNYYASEYIAVNPTYEYTVHFKNIDGMSYGFYCWYNNDELISCEQYREMDNYGLDTVITAPENANLLSLTYKKNSKASIEGYICTNPNSDINNYLTDDSDPDISDSEFTSLLDSVNISNPLSSLLQLPVQFVNAIVNQSNSCQVVNLGTLLGVPITLPCIDIGSILGTSVWDTIDILSSIGLIVLILKQLYESITNALTLGGYMDAKKSGLGYMSPLEFLCDIITGFGGDI